MANKDQNTKPKKVKRPGRGKRRFIRVSVALVLILGLIQVLSFYYADPFIRQLLQKKLVEETDGIYNIELEKINVNLAGRGFKVRGLKISPKPAFESKIAEDTVKRYYYIDFPELIVSGIDLVGLYYDRVLDISSIEVVAPEVNFKGGKSGKVHGNQHEKVYNDFYPLMRKYVKLLSIGELKFSNGSVLLQQANGKSSGTATSGDIMVTLNDFRFDSTFNREDPKLLFADNIDLEIQDYRLKLSDGIHVLEAEELVLSTSESVIEGKKIWLLPSLATDSIKRDIRNEFYDIYIPDLKITGANIFKAYFDSVLNVEEVLLAEPEIRFITNRKFTSGVGTAFDKNLYDLTSTYLHAINVDSFIIEQGRYAITRKIDQNKPDILAADINVGVTNFQIDSVSPTDLNKIFYSDDLEVAVGEFSMNLSDSIHHLAANAISFSTRDGFVKADKVNIKPDQQKLESQPKGQHELFDLQIPQMSLAGIDFKKVYNLQDLEFDRLLVSEPTMKLSDYYSRAPRSANISEATLYKLVKNYIRSIDVDQIELKDGSLEYAKYIGNAKDTIRAGRVSLVLDNFKLDSALQYASNRIFFADHISFNLDNYLMKLSDGLHILKARNVGISTRNSEVYANNIQLFPIPVRNIMRYLERSKRSVLFNINIPSLSFKGADIKKAYFQRLLNIDAITIDNPNIELNRYTNITRQRRSSRRGDELYSLFSDYLDVVSVEKMNLNNGFFNVVVNTRNDANTLSQNNMTIEATNFRLDAESSEDPNRIFYSDDIEVKLENYLVNLPDSVHVLRTKELTVSTAKSQIELKSTRLSPKQNNLASFDLPAYYDIRVPDIVMHGVDINKLYYRKILEIRDIVLNKPTLEVINEIEIKGRNQFTNRNSRSRMPRQLKGIKIAHATIKDGTMRLGNLVGNQRKIFSRANMNLNLQGILVDSLVLNNSRKILYADNLDLRMNDFSVRLPDSIHLVTTEQLDISSSKRIVNAKGFRLSPKKGLNYRQTMEKQKSKLLFDFNFPDISLTGIDLEKAYLQKDYTVRRAKLTNPTVMLKTYKKSQNDGQKIDPRDILDKLLSSQMKFLNIQQLDIANGSFALERPLNPKRKGIVLNRISGNMKQFNLNSTSSKIDSRLFYADDIDLKIKNYTYLLPDSMYTLNMGEVGVSLANRKLYFDKVKLVPRYSKYEFAKKVGKERDRIDFEARRIEFGRFDFEGYILEDKLKAGVVDIYDFDIYDFRDKRLPFPTEQRPKLPQQMIRDYDQYLRIDLLRLHDGKVTYEEFPEDGQKSGNIYFTNLNGEIRNITNSKADWKNNKMMSLHASANIMGKSKLETWITTDLSSTNNRFTVSGHLDRMDLRSVNPMLENVANVSVKSGVNDRMDFEFEGNTLYAKGEMRFRYNDLKVTVYKKKTGDKGGFVSFLANTFVINNKNPNGKNLRIGEIDQERDPTKSIFNFMWKSLLSGIKPSLGINEKNKKDKDEKVSAKESLPGSQ